MAVKKFTDPASGETLVEIEYDGGFSEILPIEGYEELLEMQTDIVEEMLQKARKLADVLKVWELVDGFATEEEILARLEKRCNG